jgi:tripartite-type tricarboxylate transporter receptor subunit TctC
MKNTRSSPSFSVAKVISLASIALAVAPAYAQNSYPTKPITLIVGYTPGGSVDLAARIIAPELGKRMGQVVVVENAAGASGQIGSAKVVNANPDGYTLLLGTSAEIATSKKLSKSVKYDGLTDLSAIYMIGTQPLILVGSPALPYKTSAELIAALKARPGKFSYGSSGNGSLPHLGGELFKQITQTFSVHIPFRGAAPMITDIVGNQIELGWLVLSSAIPQVKAGKLTAFGVSESKRAQQLPDVPALAETKGLEKMDIGLFFALFASTKTPADITGKLEKEMAEVMKNIEVRTKLVESGFTVRALNASDSRSYIQAQAKVYERVIDQSKITE